MPNMKQFVKYVLCFGALLHLSQALAFYSVQESGILVKENMWQPGAEIQLITNEDEGMNFLGRLDRGFNDESNFRFIAGTGTTSFVAGAFFKWVPFPDLESQPAVGFTVGGHVARYEGENELALRLIPFASKSFEVDTGLLTPYVSLPIAFSDFADEDRTPIQLVIGSRYNHKEFEHCEFSAELGIELNDNAPTYISVNAIFPMFEYNFN